MKKLLFIVMFLSFVVGAHAQHDAIEDEIELFYDNGEYATMMGAGCYINLKSATIIQYTIKGRFMSR